MCTCSITYKQRNSSEQDTQLRFQECMMFLLKDICLVQHNCAVNLLQTANQSTNPQMCSQHCELLSWYRPWSLHAMYCRSISRPSMTDMRSGWEPKRIAWSMETSQSWWVWSHTSITLLHMTFCSSMLELLSGANLLRQTLVTEIGTSHSVLSWAM